MSDIEKVDFKKCWGKKEVAPRVIKKLVNFNNNMKISINFSDCRLATQVIQSYNIGHNFQE